jgi:hypothetical protein
MGLKVTAQEKVVRDAKVVVDRLKEGMTWAEVAKANDVSVRMARYIVRDYFASGTGQAAGKYTDPTKIVDDLVAGYESDLWELTEAADLAWELNNVNALVGAIKGRMDARARLVEILQATNRLPKNLGQLSVIYDVRFLVEQVMLVFNEHDVAIEVKRDLLARLRPAIEGAAAVPDADAA